MSTAKTAMSTDEDQVHDWVSGKVPGNVRGWLEGYLDDDSVDDEELRNLANWDIAGAVKHIVTMLADNLRRRGEEDYVEPDSLEEVFGLKGPGGESFYSELIEFFYQNEVVAERKKAEHIAVGGAAALFEGML